MLVNAMLICMAVMLLCTPMLVGLNYALHKYGLHIKYYASLANIGFYALFISLGCMGSWLAWVVVVLLTLMALHKAGIGLSAK